jgi:hypothetical protein
MEIKALELSPSQKLIANNYICQGKIIVTESKKELAANNKSKTQFYPALGTDKKISQTSMDSIRGEMKRVINRRNFIQSGKDTIGSANNREEEF